MFQATTSTNCCDHWSENIATLYSLHTNNNPFASELRVRQNQILYTKHNPKPALFFRRIRNVRLVFGAPVLIKRDELSLPHSIIIMFTFAINALCSYSAPDSTRNWTSRKMLHIHLVETTCTRSVYRNNIYISPSTLFVCGGSKRNTM